MPIKTLNDYGLSLSVISNLSDASSVTSQFSAQFMYSDPYGGDPTPTAYTEIETEGLAEYAIASPYLLFPIPGTGRQVWPYLVNENFNRINEYLFDSTSFLNTSISEINSKFDQVEANTISLEDSVNSYIEDQYFDEYYGLQSYMFLFKDNYDLHVSEYSSYVDSTNSKLNAMDGDILHISERMQLTSIALDDLYYWKQSSSNESDSYHRYVADSLSSINYNIYDIYTLHTNLRSEYDQNLDYIIDKLTMLSYNTEEGFYRIESLESRADDIELDIYDTNVGSLAGTGLNIHGRLVTAEADIDALELTIDDADSGLDARVEATIKNVSDFDGTRTLKDDVVGNNSIPDGEVADVKLEETYIVLDSAGTGNFEAFDKFDTYHNIGMGNTVIIDDYGVAPYSNKDAVPSITDMTNYQRRNIADYIITNNDDHTNGESVFSNYAEAGTVISSLVSARITAGDTTPVDNVTIAVRGTSHREFDDPSLDYGYFDTNVSPIDLPGKYTRLYSDQLTNMIIKSGTYSDGSMKFYYEHTSGDTSVSAFNNPWSSKCYLELDNFNIQVDSDILSVSYDVESDILDIINNEETVTVESGHLTYYTRTPVLPYSSSSVTYGQIVNFDDGVSTTGSYVFTIILSEGHHDVYGAKLDSTVMVSGSLTSEIVTGEYDMPSGSSYDGGGSINAVNMYIDFNGAAYYKANYSGIYSLTSLSDSTSFPAGTNVLTGSSSLSGATTYRYFVSSVSGTEFTIAVDNGTTIDYTYSFDTAGTSAFEPDPDHTHLIVYNYGVDDYRIKMYSTQSGSNDYAIYEFTIDETDGSITVRDGAIDATDATMVSAINGSLDYTLSAGGISSYVSGTNIEVFGDPDRDRSSDYTESISITTGAASDFPVMLYGDLDPVSYDVTDSASYVLYPRSITDGGITLDRYTINGSIVIYGDDISPIFKNCYINGVLTNSADTDNPAFIMENCKVDLAETGAITINASHNISLTKNRFYNTGDNITINYNNSGNTLDTGNTYFDSHSLIFSWNMFMDAALDDASVTITSSNYDVSLTAEAFLPAMETVQFIGNRLIEGDLVIDLNDTNSWIEIEKNIMFSISIDAVTDPADFPDEVIYEHNKILV